MKATLPEQLTIVGRETQQELARRAANLRETGFNTDPDFQETFDPQLAILERVLEFDFSAYPDYAIPWPLLRWKHQRWQMVFDLIAVIETFKQVKGGQAGQRIVLDPFQVLILLAFMGPYNPSTGYRLIRTNLLTIARKNAKTTLIAALVTAWMALDPDHNGLFRQEICVAASDKKQAGETFDASQGFIMQDDVFGLENRFRIVPTTKLVQHKDTLTKLEVLSSDIHRAHGRNNRVVIFDEIGNLPAPKAKDFYQVLTTGFGAQPDATVFLLSTQAEQDSHLFSQMVDQCKQLNSNNELSKSIAGFVFDVPHEIELPTGRKLEPDPHDEQYWHLANPGIDTILLRSDMQEKSDEAKKLSSLEIGYRRLRLNQRESSHASFVTRTAWLRCKGDAYPPEHFRGRRCALGLDLGKSVDMAALVASFEPVDDEQGIWQVYPWFWMPGIGVKDRAKNDKVPYWDWAMAGHIELSPGRRTIDFSQIAEQIQWCYDEYDVVCFAYDRWKMKDLRMELEELQMTDIVEKEGHFFEIGQGYKDMSPCVSLLENHILDEQLNHGGHPVLTWNALNAVVTMDPTEARKFDKPKSYARIDGIVATAMSLRAWDLIQQQEKPEHDVSRFASGFSL